MYACCLYVTCVYDVLADIICISILEDVMLIFRYIKSNPDHYHHYVCVSSAGELYTEAADVAMAAMKGRLANKYYALAEEAWAQVEEE